MSFRLTDEPSGINLRFNHLPQILRRIGMRSLTLLVTFICMVFATSVITANDGNLPDTLMVDRVQVEKGGKAALNVNFVNDEELAALTIPLGLVGDMYLIDSVSFVGSRVEYLKMRPVTIAENRTEVVFGAICMTEDYIPAGRGLMATVFLSPVDSAKSDFCVIDTITMGPASVLFTKVNSASFIPEFQSGMLSLQKEVKKESAVKESPEGESAEKKDE